MVVARGWSEPKKRAYMLADNKLALNAGWDEALLRVELADLREMGADLNLIGFDAGELAALFADKPGLTDPDEAPAPEEHAVSRPGDAWLLGAHRLVCGDCTDRAHGRSGAGRRQAAPDGHRPALRGRSTTRPGATGWPGPPPSAPARC